MKRRLQKLHLHRETLRQLGEQPLHRIGGGSDDSEVVGTTEMPGCHFAQCPIGTGGTGGIPTQVNTACFNGQPLC